MDTKSQISLTASKPKDSHYPTVLNTLGDHIRRRRIDLGQFQRDVARQIGVCEATVWNWEKGGLEPEIKHLPAIIAFLGYDPLSKPETVGEKLVAFRLAKGWTQKRLAAELRVDPTTLSRWELGMTPPWGEYAERVNSFLKSIVVKVQILSQ